MLPASSTQPDSVRKEQDQLTSDASCKANLELMTLRGASFRLFQLSVQDSDADDVGSAAFGPGPLHRAVCLTGQGLCVRSCHQ